MCAMCVSFFVLQKKKKETERKWKGSLSLSFIKPSCACCYSAYGLILQLIQFLDNSLSHHIQNIVKLHFMVTVKYFNMFRTVLPESLLTPPSIHTSLQLEKHYIGCRLSTVLSLRLPCLYISSYTVVTPNTLNPS